MLPIRPINEELSRLHRPIVSAEEDDERLDAALQGFSLTSMVPHSRPAVGTVHLGKNQRRSSSSGSSYPSSTGTPPLYTRHAHSRSNGLSGGSTRSYSVLYPVTTTGAPVEMFHPRQYHHPRQPRHHYHGLQQHHHVQSVQTPRTVHSVPPTTGVYYQLPQPAS